MISILHVDDEQINYQLVKLNLLQLESNLEITWAESGEKAIELIKEKSFDCILSDFQMPKMNGLEFLKKFRDRGDSTPFIFLTGQGNEETATEAFRMGVDDYFTKEEGFAHYERMLNSIKKHILAHKQKQEHINIEEALIKSKKNYRELLQTSHDLVFNCDKEGCFSYINPAWERVLGYRPEEMLAHPFSKFTTPDRAENDLKIFKSVLIDGKETCGYETIYISKSGKDVHLSFNTRALKDTEGNIIGTHGTARDITGRMQYEEELHRYKQMVSISSDMLALFDKGFCCLAVNQGYFAAFGKTQEELIGLSASEIFGDDFFKTVFQPNAQRCFNGEDVHYQAWFDFPIHGRQHMDITCITYRSDNEIKGFVMKSRNITEKQQGAKELKDEEKTKPQLIEELEIFRSKTAALDSIKEKYSKIEGELELERKRLRLVLEAIPVWVYLQSPDYSIKWYNKHFLDLFGHPNNRPCYKAIQGKENPCDPCPTFTVFETKKLQKWEYTDDKSGKTSIIYDNYFLDSDGSPLVLEMGIDITDRKNAENELRKSRDQLEKMNSELTRLDKLKDEFLANTSHELKTPLNQMIGLAESLIDGITGTLPEETILNLAMIVSSGLRLTNLVNDILDFSKLKHQDIELKIKPIDIRTLSDVVLSLSKPIARQKGITLLNNISPEVPFANGDEDRIQQVLHNLLSNAIKFTEEGEVSVSTKIEGEFIAVSVIDSGIGISSEQQKNIFKSFEQADGSIEREYGGTGLGLAISKKLINLHGGQIGVESEKNRGCRFWFTLPLAKQENSTQDSFKESKVSNILKLAGDFINIDDSINQQAAGKEKLHGESIARILAVDDDPINLQILANHLSLQNVSITKVTNGSQAIAEIKKADESGKAFDLVLLDIMMPRMSGYEVCKILRKKFTPDKLPIMLLTAKNKVDDLVVGLDSGANDYLAKPFRKKELIAKVNTQLDLKFLADKQRKSEKEIIKLNEDLESKIEVRTAELVASNKSLNSFAYMVSHDLRSPIIQIINMSKMLKKSLPADLSENSLEFLELIIKKGNKTSVLINDLLNFSKTAEGKLTKVKTDMNSLVEYVINESKAGFKDQEIEWKIQNLPDTTCDIAVFKQVFLNLVSNAVKFSGNKKKTVIEIGAEPESSDQNMLIFYVKDNGSGFDMKHADKIFEVFHRLHSDTEFPGTGIGLALVKKIIACHGGKIWVESEVDAGATFYFSLPKDE